MTAAAPNLLVVDDLPANLQLLTETLRTRGFKVRPVASGAMALEVARHAPPDLILLDVMMPGMDGFQVCAALKEEPSLKDIPVIFVSALGETPSKLAGFRAGGVDYLTRPFEPDEVVARVRTHLELARLRRELAQHNADLEDAVARRTRELAEANARLGLLDQAKSDFLHMISHELRTPLNGVFGATELLLADADNTREVGECARIYQVSRDRLMALIEDALLLSEVGASVATGSAPEFELAGLLHAAVVAAEPAAAARGVRFETAPAKLGPVRGDEEHIARALKALVETAVKFALPGGSVSFVPLCGDGRVGFSVQTLGGAVPPDVLPKLFELLATALPLAAGEDLGLAPAVAQRIVRLYGGQLSVANLEPRGVRFDLQLPLASTSGGGSL